MRNQTHRNIEQQLTVLLRRVAYIHRSTQPGEVALERSAYAIMCHLADEGPHRLGTLATTFGVDASTISRQAHDLEKAGLARRTKDPSDRRAYILELTDHGCEALQQSRGHRRVMLEQTLSDWPRQDLTVLSKLLKELNNSMDRLGAFGILLAAGSDGFFGAQGELLLGVLAA